MVAVDNRTKAYRLGKIVTILDSDNFGIVFDSWYERFNAILSEKMNKHRDEVIRASFIYKPKFFHMYQLVCVKHNGKFKRGQLGFKINPLNLCQTVKLIDQAKFVQIENDKIFALHVELGASK